MTERAEADRVVRLSHAGRRPRGGPRPLTGMEQLLDISYSHPGTTALQELRGALDGRVIAPAEPGYDEARTVFYGGFDRRPAVIVRPSHDRDVARVVTVAREGGLELAVRGGGHSLAGHGVSDGGIVLDLSALRGLDIDVGRRSAWAETGLTAGEYTTAAASHGLATGFGDTTSVGIGGITLGGGIGLLVRQQGLTIDNLLAADVVTADGRLLRADADTNPDLFWAIRGGGGNFGVATRLHLRLHEVGTVVGGMLVLPATPEVVAGFVAEAQAAPEALSAIANVMPAPPMPSVPAEHHGKPVVMALLVHNGAVDEGERAVAPFRSLATPIADMVRPMPYPETFEPVGDDYHPTGTVRTLFRDDLDQHTAESILDRLRASTAPMRVAQIRLLGGAVDRVPADATAYPHRGRALMLNVGVLYDPSADATPHEAWADDLATALRQDGAAAYVNFLADEGAARVRDAYPGPTWDRLRAVKLRYDPTNLFRLNQNIPPAGHDAATRDRRRSARLG